MGCLQWAPFEPAKLACATEDGQVSLWTLEAESAGATPLQVHTEHADAVSGLAWSLVSQRVLTLTLTLTLTLNPNPNPNPNSDSDPNPNPDPNPTAWATLCAAPPGSGSQSTCP